MGKSIQKSIKKEILEKIKNEGLSVSDAANFYNVSTKAIYNWLNKDIEQSVSFLRFNKLKRENEDLYRIIGKLTVALKKGRKD